MFITHKLGEAAAFGDRISVLKLGRKVGEITPARLRSLARRPLITEIVEMMFGGRPVTDASAMPAVRRPDDAAVAARCATSRLRHGRYARPRHRFPSTIRPGEILGIAGIDGNGQKQLAEALSGQRRAMAAA